MCVCSFVRTKFSLFLTCQFCTFALRNSIVSHETKSVFTFRIGLSNKIDRSNKVNIGISSQCFAFKIRNSNNSIEIKHFCNINSSQNSFSFHSGQVQVEEKILSILSSTVKKCS